MRFVLVATLVAAGAVTLGACGGDNSGSVVTTSPAATSATTVLATTSTVGGTSTSSGRPATTVRPSTTTAAAGAATTNPQSVESVTEKATAALLAPGDVGAGFATEVYTPSDPGQPGVCGQAGIDTAVPAAVRVGTVVSNATTQQALLQEVRVYQDEEEATMAYRAASDGVSCTTGSMTLDDGTTQPVTITAPVDVVAQVGGDEATGWQLQTADTKGVAVLVRLQAAIVSFQFQAPAAADATDPDPLAVVKLGVAKVAAA